MHSNETKAQFIELRARELSLERIARQIGISKPTAVDWQRRFKSQIDTLKALRFEAIRERLATSFEEDLSFAVGQLRRIRAELAQRDWGYENTTALFYAEAAAYRRIEKLCHLTALPEPAADPAPSQNTSEPPAADAAAENFTVSLPFPYQKTGGCCDLTTSPPASDEQSPDRSPEECNTGQPHDEPDQQTEVASADPQHLDTPNGCPASSAAPMGDMDRTKPPPYQVEEPGYSATSG